MNHVSKLLLVTATAVAVASAGTVIAYAGWPVASGPVQVKVRAMDMPQGVRPSAARSGPDAVVTWSAQEIGPGATMQSYVVRRHDADGARAVKAFDPVAGTTFTDPAVPAGRWYWTVTPRFARWTGAESRKSENLRFTAPEPTAPVANTAATRAPAPAATTRPSTTGGSEPAAVPPAPANTVTTPKAAEPPTTTAPAATEEVAEPTPPATSSAPPDDE
jgi:hypothetical protein